jgi:hypothetical protein
VLVYQKKTYTYVTRCVAKQDNEAFARAYWGVDEDGDTWELMYFLSQPSPIGLPSDELADILPAQYRGFTRIEDKTLTRIERSYGSLEEFVARRLSVRIAPPQTYEPTAGSNELEKRVALLRAAASLPRPQGNKAPRRVAGQQLAYEREPTVKAWVLQEARGLCELCGQRGPFKLPTGELFLEVHHVRPLADGGPDTVENAVALCPNCHRWLHLGRDAQQQREVLYSKLKRLVRA